MKNILIILFLLISPDQIQAQVIYLNTNSDDIFKLDITTCEYEFVVHVEFNPTDISFHPDGNLFGIDPGGRLVEIDTISGAISVLHNFNGQTFNSLTIAGNGIIYTTGDQGEIWSYNKNTDQATYHGDMGFRATGDLTFYKGELYVATLHDRIVRVDINNPPNSSVVIDGNISGEIFGIISYAENCDSINCYAISSGESSIYLIDFNTKTLQLVCELDIRAGGGASTYEFLGSSPIVFENITSTDPECNFDNGTITMNITGGNPPLIYSLNDTIFQSSPTFDLLSGGVYSIRVTDVNGCTFAQEVTLSELGGPVLEDLSATPGTCGEPNGSINIVATNANGPIHYSIDGENYQTSNIFQDVDPGMYNVTVQDTSGCSDFGSIEVPGIPFATIDSVLVVSPGCTNIEGSLMVIATGSSEIQYSLDGILFQDENTFENLLPGSYSITVRDENGCTDTTSVSIEDARPLFIDEIQSSPTTCGESNGSIVIMTSGGGGLIKYSIDKVQYQESNEFLNLGSGTYEIEVVDENGCMADGMIEILGSIPIIVENIITVPADCGEQNGSTAISVTGGTGKISISLDGNTSPGNNSFANLSPGIHEINIEDENICRVDTIINIEQLLCHIYIPNTFSPNLDGINDYFKISTSVNFDATVNKYLIFDRWGNMIYSASEFSILSSENWWDGTYKRITMNPGVFAYFIEVEDPSGVKESYKGNVTLIR